MLAASMLVVAGCEDKAAQPPLAPPKQAPGPSSPAAAPAVTPPSGAPHAAAAPASNAPMMPAPVEAAVGNDSTVLTMGVSVTLPTGWKRNPPANQMRLAEAVVADASGDPAKVCSVVFSTAGGSVEDNVARWSGQVRDAAGQPATPKSEKRTINGLPVTVVSMEGSFAGMGDPAPRPNWMLRGAIVETPSGLLFIKMNGPAQQMTAAGDAFTKMVDSIKKP